LQDEATTPVITTQEKYAAYKTISDLPISNMIIVPRASVHSDGKLFPILQDRADTALNFYLAETID